MKTETHHYRKPNGRLACGLSAGEAAFGWHTASTDATRTNCGECRSRTGASAPDLVESEIQGPPGPGSEATRMNASHTRRPATAARDDAATRVAAAADRQVAARRELTEALDELAAAHVQAANAHQRHDAERADRHAEAAERVQIKADEQREQLPAAEHEQTIEAVQPGR